MAKKIKYFDSQIGRNTNSGDNPMEPLRDADAFNKLVLDPGDEVWLRAGQTFEGGFKLTRSGAPDQTIKIKTYRLGNERSLWASVKADGSATRPISFEVAASHIDLDHITAIDGRYCGFMFREKQGHINGDNLRARRCGIGTRMRASYTQLNYLDVQNPTMSRAEGKPTDEGGVAVSVEATDGNLNTSNVLYRAYISGAIADAPAPNKFDGGGVEIFGDIKGLRVDGCVFLWGDGLVEVGGPTPVSGARPATTRDVVFKNNLAINMNVMALFNDPAKLFPIRVANMTFKNNTFVDRLRNRSAVYFQGDWDNLADVVTFESNIYSGLGSWVGTSGATDLNKINRRGNVYQRIGGTGLGYSLGPDDWIGDPKFIDPDTFDFRLSTRPNEGLMKTMPGALDAGLSYDSMVDLKWLLKQARIPFSANDIRGGIHSYEYHRHMWAIPFELRAAGMQCYISTFDHTFRLAPDLKTWIPIGEDFL